LFRFFKSLKILRKFEEIISSLKSDLFGIFCKLESWFSSSNQICRRFKTNSCIDIFWNRRSSQYLHELFIFPSSSTWKGVKLQNREYFWIHRLYLWSFNSINFNLEKYFLGVESSWHIFVAHNSRNVKSYLNIDKMILQEILFVF
jgi:hypothetical protein